MALNLQLLDGIVKAYGAPLYNAEPSAVVGSLQPSEYTLMADGRTISVEEGGLMYYFPIRRAVIEAGIPADKVFTIGTFVALRDADGIGEDGKPWTVAKGAIKAFAY